MILNKTKKLKKGISLMVLIITIIVVIILAAVVILTLSKNNPIESAKEAAFKEDMRAYQDELAMTVSKQYAEAGGHRDNKITTLQFEKIKEYIPSFIEKYKEKIYIQNDNLVYNNDEISEKEFDWLNSLKIEQMAINSGNISANLKKYYSKDIINYSTGNDSLDNSDIGWKIFYADENNIYLIADDFIDFEYIPKGKNNTEVTVKDNNRNYIIGFDNVVNDYTGTVDILNSKAINWITWASRFPDTETNAAKTIAYLLDTNVWNIYEGEKAEYAIGAPTLELYSAAYDKLYDDGFTFGIGKKGYSISKEYINSIFPKKNKNGGSFWLASPPSASYWTTNNIFYTGYGSGQTRVFRSGYSGVGGALRPVICLKEGISLKETENGYEIY